MVHSFLNIFFLKSLLLEQNGLEREKNLREVVSGGNRCPAEAGGDIRRCRKEKRIHILSPCRGWQKSPSMPAYVLVYTGNNSVDSAEVGGKEGQKSTAKSST